ncbi:uncharacterized protein LOC107039773 isoform X2 [Diachasma alloeum]|nr:uncharacterized protein LOC107039773 isoform X2 [Diachasma alloeum]
MEDDDGEGSNAESQVLTDSESLKIHHNSTSERSDLSDDEKEEEKGEVVGDDDEEEEEEEIYPENFPTRLPNPVSHPVFKGFKKRIIQEKPAEEPGETASDERRGPNSRRGKITEYAQYLGLQPAAKYNKCSKCNATNSHRNQGRDECLCQSQVAVGTPETSPTPSPSDNHPSTSKITNNFRITRKVYLCAACGTYFENWNLFLHMRDIHKRHICLFCLGMFGQAERLSHHLEKKHSVTEKAFSSVEDFYKAFKGSCYLICCSCEKVFSETDNFYNHFCPTSPSGDKSPEEEVCMVCRHVGSHAVTCQRHSEVSNSGKSGVKTGSKGLIARSKNHRVKRSEKHMLTSYQKKLTQLYERKMTLKTERKSLDSAPSEPTVSSDVCTPEIPQSVEKPVEPCLSRDTVAETILQVSKLSQDPEESSPRPAPLEAEIIGDKHKESVQEVESREESRNNWDSVTETIMRVSRFEAPEQLESEKFSRDCPGDRLIEPSDQEMLIDESNPREEAPHDLDRRDESSSDDVDDYENNENDEESLKKLESTPMSVSRVNRTKGSLVIKICTNKNSHYSVSTPNMNGVDESEDNNNESDSDNDRLTVALSDEIKRTREDVEPSEGFNELGDGVADVSDNAENPLSQSVEEPGLPEGQREAIQEREESAKLNSGNFEGNAGVAGGRDNIQLAGEDVPTIDLNVNDLLESLPVVDLLKGCIEAASPTCVYCNHARHIAVNAKQLALHMLAEHRFQPQHPAIIIQAEQFVNRVRKSIDQLDGHYLNADSYDSDIGTYNVPTIRMYECFNCRVVSHIHKDLYLHNRKMHQKTILICVMCKSTFYSYSELLCHLCPGIYSATETDMSTQSLTSSILNPSIKYRCCICTIDPLPSAFRLMVHLRKRHHACDVCLELNGNQQRLSNHVWKHKLQHLCYRCGIAYRNKPDITKHLFWKHGTESVLCKKCLQKKWPHIYHFCIPPSAFICEECNVSFSRAVALKVHKRLHSKEEPYTCADCNQKFISKKLLMRHEEEVHRPPPEPPEPPAEVDDNCGNNGDANGLQEEGLAEGLHQKSGAESSGNESTMTGASGPTSASQNQGSGASPTGTPSGTPDLHSESQRSEPVRKVVDVYDLPPLNLSSDSDSDDDENDKSEGVSRNERKEEADGIEETKDDKGVDESEPIDEHQEQQVDIMNGIWDNFKFYATTTETNLEELAKSEEKIIEAKQRELVSIITADHDYCVVYGDSKIEEEPEEVQNSPKTVDLEENGVTITDSVNEADQAFLTEVTINEVNEVSIPAAVESDAERKKEKSPKKRNSNSSSSDSSSDSDSSSCSCGTNCSCSSSSSDSSSSSSSSSDSDSSASESSPKKSEGRKRERKRGKNSQHKRPKEGIGENEGASSAVNDVNADEEVINAHTIEEPNVVDVQEQYELPVYPSISPAPVVPPERRNVMRESDLETDETETDEDFYDEHPQELANKLLAEKRNQLLQLANVAAPSESSSTVKNGVMENALDIESQTSSRKKIKVKKRKKTSESRRGARAARGARGTRGRRPKYPGPQVAGGTHVEPPIKINIPKQKFNRQKHPKIRFSAVVPPVNAAGQSEYSVNNSTAVQTSQPSGGYSGASGASGTETPGSESKRASKRKRIPKKFYGDSSDDEQQNQYPKWRRIESNPGMVGSQGAQQGHQYVPTITIKQNFGPPLQSK